MGDADARSILHRYCKKLAAAGVDIPRQPDEETIHQFRVNIKKLHAFLRMLRDGSVNKPPLQLPKRLKKMYRQVGEIRDRQLCLKRLKMIFLPSDDVKDTISALEKKIRDLLKEKSVWLHKQEFIALEQQLATILAESDVASPETLPTPFALEKDVYFRLKKRNIEEVLLAGNFKDDELHTIRKNLKDMLYLSKLYKDDLKTPVPGEWSDDHVKFVERLTDVLGAFNDTRTASAILRHEQSLSDPPGGDGLRRLLHYMSGEKCRLKKKALLQFRKLQA
ncbi:CHAD domain-containing protein [Flavihumibacter petaseus]|uniref:CHAD domain-containing protein n=1 Tax=Flavihumibacter petaseus NBRC 106054 TaxID=1220578 RepID=A0A0E9N1X3_9BACT|nr:CHAD domain-containing protein [Flavihumibacter petaseus]GAO44017.1 hypothetical protein FPE01S_03_00560 [Flavihumibacter petaseus NBRC 106054]